MRLDSSGKGDMRDKIETKGVGRDRGLDKNIKDLVHDLPKERIKRDRTLQKVIGEIVRGSIDMRLIHLDKIVKNECIDHWE